MNDHIEQLADKLAKLPETIHIVICHQITLANTDVGHHKELLEGIRSNITVIQKYEKGLSKSRNCALNYVQDGICMITDDDVEFPIGFEQHIFEAYNSNPHADIITFQAITPEGDYFKTYSSFSYSHTQRSVAKVSSIEITFLKKSSDRMNLTFDERFGLGTKYSTSEEYIFLTDALKKRLKAIYVPHPIAIHPLESSGKQFNERQLNAKGAVIRRVYGSFAPLINVAFILKKYPLFKKDITLFQGLSYIFAGYSMSKQDF